MSTMKLFALSTLLAAAGQASAFAPSSTHYRTTSLMANVLEGREIEKDFTPINNMLLVKRAEVIDQTGGGLFLTGKQKINKSEGLVTAAGDGRVNSETGFKSPMPVSVGDVVSFGKFDGEEVNYNGAIHTLIRDDDILVKYPAGAERTVETAEVVWDSVLVKVIIQEIAETGGILIAATTKKATKSSTAEVLKVGPGRFAFNGALMDMDVAPGDMVKFRDFAAQEVTIGDEAFAVVRMSDLLAKF